MSRVSTVGTLRVDSRLPADSFALILDMRNGVGLHRGEEQTVFVNSEFAFIQSPLQSVEVLTSADFDALFLRFAREAVIGELQKLLGREAKTELVFSPVFRRQSAAGHHLRELSESLWRKLCDSKVRRSNDDAFAKSLPTQELEIDIITLLLQAQPHNYTRLLNRGSAAGAWQLSAAEEYMRANAHLPISLGDICLAAGVNARTLQYSFSRKRGCNPMQFLREIRMDGVRRSLLNPENSTSVTREAARWGFLHFGRFSHEYRATFGELPSETLRRSRRTSSVQRELNRQVTTEV